VGSSSRIEWTDATWNPVAGCSSVSPGCLNCYAARMALRLAAIGTIATRKYVGTARRSPSGRPYFTGVVHTDPRALNAPRNWRRPRRVFVNSMSDLFHEKIPEPFIRQVFAVMDECRRHTFQVLTKRPERVEAMAARLPWPPNVWLGTSVESKAQVERVRVLVRAPARIKFISAEPLLGPIPRLPLSGIDWVIAGGESGPRARPMHPEWVRQIRDRCVAARVGFFFKQWGGVNKKAGGRTLDGRTWDEYPRDN